MEFAEIWQAVLEFLADSWDVILFSLSGLAMVVGWIGMLVPMFPAGIVMWVAALLTGINFGFGVWGWIIFFFISILALVLFVVDDLVLINNARKEGIPAWMIVLSMFLALMVTFFVNPIAGLFTSPVVIFIYEYIKKREFDQAIRMFGKIFSGVGVMLIIRFAIGFVILVLWGIWMVIVI